MISSAFRFDQKTGYMLMKFGKIIHPLSAYRLILDEFDSFNQFRDKFGIKGDLPELKIEERDYIDAYSILFCGEDEYKNALNEIWESVFSKDGHLEKKKIFQEKYEKKMLTECFETFLGKNPLADQIIEWIESVGEEGNYEVYGYLQNYLMKLKM